jgi:RNA polymerase sigma-70 factor (ECF subfamily)
MSNATTIQVVTTQLLNADIAVRFEQEVVPLLDRLYGAAMRLTQNNIDAEDLIQETLLNAYRSFASFQQGTYVMAWLSRIMVNTRINQYRKAQRRPVEYPSITIDDGGSGHREDRVTSSASRTTEEEVLEPLLDSEIGDALRALPSHLRETIHYIAEGYHYDEIAKLTNVPVGTVMSRVYRARTRLRSQLSDMAVERRYIHS